MGKCLASIGANDFHITKKAKILLEYLLKMATKRNFFATLRNKDENE
jgi:hypothetical protein